MRSENEMLDEDPSEPTNWTWCTTVEITGPSIASVDIRKSLASLEVIPSLGMVSPAYAGIITVNDVIGWTLEYLRRRMLDCLFQEMRNPETFAIVEKFAVNRGRKKLTVSAL